MNKKLLSFIVVLFLVSGIFGQTNRGIVIEDLKVPSEILGEDASYTIYLPADYETSKRYYPVVYLLHGYTDDDSGWLQFGEVNRIDDAGIASGEIPPMIIVMPDRGVSWYINPRESAYSFASSA